MILMPLLRLRMDKAHGRTLNCLGNRFGIDWSFLSEITKTAAWYKRILAGAALGAMFALAKRLATEPLRFHVSPPVARSLGHEQGCEGKAVTLREVKSSRASYDAQARPGLWQDSARLVGLRPEEMLAKANFL